MTTPSASPRIPQAWRQKAAGLLPVLPASTRRAELQAPRARSFAARALPPFASMRGVEEVRRAAYCRRRSRTHRDRPTDMMAQPGIRSCARSASVDIVPSRFEYGYRLSARSVARGAARPASHRDGRQRHRERRGVHRGRRPASTCSSPTITCRARVPSSSINHRAARSDKHVAGVGSYSRSSPPRARSRVAGAIATRAQPRRLLDLVALGGRRRRPLDRVNRIFVDQGLAHIAQTCASGVRALFAVAGRDAGRAMPVRPGEAGHDPQMPATCLPAACLGHIIIVAIVPRCAPPTTSTGRRTRAPPGRAQSGGAKSESSMQDEACPASAASVANDRSLAVFRRELAPWAWWASSPPEAQGRYRLAPSSPRDGELRSQGDRGLSCATPRRRQRFRGNVVGSAGTRLRGGLTLASRPPDFGRVRRLPQLTRSSHPRKRRGARPRPCAGTRLLRENVRSQGCLRRPSTAFDVVAKPRRGRPAHQLTLQRDGGAVREPGNRHAARCRLGWRRPEVSSGRARRRWSSQSSTGGPPDPGRRDGATPPRSGRRRKDAASPPRPQTGSSRRLLIH